MGVMLIVLEKFGHLLSRCKIYELLYLGGNPENQATANLESALINLYAEIMQYLAIEVQLYEYKKGVLFRVASPSPYPDQVAARTKKTHILGVYVDTEASLCENTSGHNARSMLDNQAKCLMELFKETQKPPVRVGSQISYSDQSLCESAHREVLSWTSSASFKEDHDTARRGRTDSTGQWLLEHEVYRDWRASSASMILWLHGCGKLGSDYSSYSHDH